jgi:pimeloyl-ACP methyl ester carboxylesterase
MGVVESKFVKVDGIETHYFEAGRGPHLVLLHSGEFGGCAELTWEYNMEALAQHFHVLAPDWLGFGRTAKFYDFEDMWHTRIRHMAAFVRTMGVDRAHFVGNSMGGTMLLYIAQMKPCPLPIDKVIAVSGGGNVIDNAARQVLNSYDGSLDHMRKIVQTLFMNPKVRDDEAYVVRRQEAAMVPGAWECTAAPRLRVPGRPALGLSRPMTYADITAPVLIIAGEHDNLRNPGYGEELQREIPSSTLYVVKGAGHCPQIDAPEEFNRVAIDFLQRR